MKLSRIRVGASVCAGAALALCLSSVSLVACGDEPRPPVEPAPVAPPPPTAPPSTPAAAAAEPEPTAEELPIADDFAAEAEQQIDAKSYRAELDMLDKEITAEPAP
jgi:hypothetical protein